MNVEQTRVKLLYEKIAALERRHEYDVKAIDRLTREKSEATSDLICAHREIERHKQEIARLDAERMKLLDRVGQLARECGVKDAALEHALAALCDAMHAGNLSRSYYGSAAAKIEAAMGDDETASAAQDTPRERQEKEDDRG